VDRAQALVRLRVSLGIPTWEEVGTLIGIRRAHVYRLLSIAKLPEEIREDIRVGNLTEKHGRALLSLRAHPAHQLALWDRIHAEHLSGDDSITLASSLRQHASSMVPVAPRQNGDPDAAPGSPTPITASESENDGRPLHVLQPGEPVVDAPPPTPPPASSAACRRELRQAIQTMSRALATATPADRLAVRVELATLGDTIHTALEGC
jgi:HTH domain found in ParB protein